jgi:hypothetical protein
MKISNFILIALLTGTDGGTWAACEFGMTVERGMDSIHGSARVTDLASQARTAGKAAAPTMWWCGQMARCTGRPWWLVSCLSRDI